MTSTELRELIESSGLSQREIARMLVIDERTLRRYLAGDLPIPKVVELAVTCLIDHAPPDNQNGRQS